MPHDCPLDSPLPVIRAWSRPFLSPTVAIQTLWPLWSRHFQRAALDMRYPSAYGAPPLDPGQGRALTIQTRCAAFLTVPPALARAATCPTRRPAPCGRGGTSPATDRS